MVHWCALFVLSCVFSLSPAARIRRQAFVTNRNVNGQQQQQQQNQVNSVCPRPTGRFPLNGNCTHFISCYQNTPYTLVCPNNLVFNPATGDCDHSANVPRCSGNPSNYLCANNPGNPSEAWKVAHPEFCNAFFTCEGGDIHRRCEVCSPRSYFNQAVGNCVEVDETRVGQVCGNRQVVPFEQLTKFRLSDPCNLFVPENVFRPVFNDVMGRMGNRNANRNFNNNNNNNNNFVPNTNNNNFVPNNNNNNFVPNNFNIARVVRPRLVPNSVVIPYSVPFVTY